jgi:alkaline phosphatase D
MALEGNWNRGEISRRALLGRAGMGMGALALYAGGFSNEKAWAKPFFHQQPFSLGVASGDPLPDGVVLWTRLAPDPLVADGGMPARKVPVRYEVATDEGFRHVVRKGNTHATPELAHSVHVYAFRSPVIGGVTR